MKARERLECGMKIDTKAGTISMRSSLSDKVRFTLAHMRNMMRHADRASVAGRAAVISAWYAGRGLASTRSSDEVRSMRSPEWGEFCMAEFRISAARAAGLMKLPEAFRTTDDIPDDCDSVDKAVRFARATLGGLRRAALRRDGRSNKSIEKGYKDWLAQVWAKDGYEQLKRDMGVTYPSTELKAEVAVRGAARERPESGYIDLLAKHPVKDWWTIFEVKAGLAGERDLAKLLWYERALRAMPGARPGMRVDLVFVCQQATPGLATAAAREGVRLVEWGHWHKVIVEG